MGCMKVTKIAGEKKPVNIRLPSEIIEKLDGIAKANKITREALIRAIISTAVNDPKFEVKIT